MISTPYRRSGLMYNKWKQHFGVNSDDVLVIQGDAKTFNPTLDDAVIAAQRAAWTGPAIRPRRLYVGHVRLYLSHWIERLTGHRPFEYRNYDEV